jgi:hypothetical protein
MTLYVTWGDADLCLSNSTFEDVTGDMAFSTASATQQLLLISRRRSRADLKTIFIRDLADPRVSLNGPLPVTIENLGDQVTVYSADTGDYGVGADEQSAIDEFRAAIVDVYFMLKDERQALGPLPQRHWNFLSSIIDER